MPSLPKTTLNYQYLTEICRAISLCYGGVKPCVIFTTNKMFPAIRKDAVPTI